MAKRPTLESTLNIDIRRRRDDWRSLGAILIEVPCVSDYGTVIAFSTPCRFGGVRWWYQCQQCRKGRLVLYWIESRERFVCAKCTNAVHASSQMGKVARGTNRRIDLLKKYDLINSIDGLTKLEDFHRPKGMHRATWATICKRYNQTFSTASHFGFSAN